MSFTHDDAILSDDCPDMTSPIFSVQAASVSPVSQ